MACEHCGQSINGGWLCDECHTKWVKNPNRHMHGKDCRERGEQTKHGDIVVSDDLDELLGKEKKPSYGRRLADGFAAFRGLVRRDL